VASSAIAAVRRQVTAASLSREAMKAPIWSLTQRRGVVTSGMIVVYPDRPDIMLINGSAGITVDIGLKVDSAFHGDSMLQSLATPAGRVAWARYQGPYAMLPVIHTDIRAWCIDRGHRITGLCWDHYSHWHEEPERRVTEVYYQLA